MREIHKEVILPGRLEVTYEVLNTYERYDGEIMATCKKNANNITPRGVIENDCGIDTIALSSLQNM